MRLWEKGLCTDSLASEFAHDGIQGLVILLQQHIQLLVLVLELLILYHKSGIHAFDLRFK